MAAGSRPGQQKGAGRGPKSCCGPVEDSRWEGCATFFFLIRQAAGCLRVCSPHTQLWHKVRATKAHDKTTKAEKVRSACVPPPPRCCRRRLGAKVITSSNPDSRFFAGMNSHIAHTQDALPTWGAASKHCLRCVPLFARLLASWAFAALTFALLAGCPTSAHPKSAGKQQIGLVQSCCLKACYQPCKPRPITACGKARISECLGNRIWLPQLRNPRSYPRELAQNEFRM